MINTVLLILNMLRRKGIGIDWVIQWAFSQAERVGVVADSSEIWVILELVSDRILFFLLQRNYNLRVHRIVNLMSWV